MPSTDIKKHLLRISIRARNAGLLINVIAAQVVVVMPGYVHGLVSYLHYTEKQAGYLAAIESMGFMVMTMLMIYLSSRFSWQLMCRMLLITVVITNLLSICLDKFEIFATIRFIAGLGSGGLLSLSFASLGLTSEPERSYGYTIMLVVIYGAIVLAIMPTAYDMYGMTSVLLFFSVFASLGLFFVHSLPDIANHESKIKTQIEKPHVKYIALGLAAIFTYWLAQGAIWSYMFLIGTANGVGEDQIARSLSLSQLTGFAGACTTAFLASRFGKLRPLSIAYFSIILSVVMLYFGSNFMLFLFIVCLYNYAWNLSDPYLMSVMANLGNSARLVVYAVAVRKLGFAIGPAIAAMLLFDANYDYIILFGTTFFILSFLLIVPVLLRSPEN